MYCFPAYSCDVLSRNFIFSRFNLFDNYQNTKGDLGKQLKFLNKSRFSSRAHLQENKMVSSHSAYSCVSLFGRVKSLRTHS